MSYASRNWKAVETTDFAGSKHSLTVTGEVQVTRSNETPKLTKATPQGISPATLILRLAVESTGDSGGGGSWKQVEYAADIASREFADVTITGATDERTIKVDEVLS